VVRLYAPVKFEVGGEILLSSSEMRYFKGVRRGQGPVVLFNSFGQIAHGTIEGNVFLISEVELASASSLDLRVALALPESAVVFQLVRQLSELGVRSLHLFGAERSQKSKARLSLEFKERLEKIAIESCRQSGRDRPLEIDFVHFSSLQSAPEVNRFVFDENESSNQVDFSASKSTLMVIGCEGGWTSSERSSFEQWGYRRVHWPIPVLKVDTAAVAAVGWALPHFFV
jgi:RsmE family RNA methyltransferase